MSLRRNKQTLYRYLLLVGLVLLLALLGYIFFLLYVQGIRPSNVGSGLVLLAIAAGLASLFSPCSFPLLVTILAREAATNSKKTLVRTAVAFTLGVMVFLMLLGTALAVGAGSFISQFSFASDAGRILRLIVGLILIGFGLWQIRGQSLNFIWLNQLLQPLWHTQTRWRRKSTTLGYGLYGFGYILAGFGWTGPILAGLALHALTVANETAAFTAFLTAAITIAVVMAVLVFAISLAQTHVVTTLKRGTRTVKRGSGFILLAVGTWLMALAIWADMFAQILFP